MIARYRPSDLDDIDLTPEHRLLAEVSATSMEKLAREGFAWTSLAASNQVLALLGAVPQLEEGCEVFIFPSATLAVRYPKTLFTDVAAKLDDARARFPGRVQSITRPEAPAANRFLAHLGFDRDGKRGEYLKWVLV